MNRFRLFTSLAALALTVGCATTQTEDLDDEAALERTASMYPTTLRDIRKLGQLDPLNVNIADFSSEARDQGALASCASHGFLGMIENELFVDRGITVDFSERYMLFANFMATKNMGNEPKVIARFPEIAMKYGLLAESSYRYADIQVNGARFQQDLAQGRTDDPNALTVDLAIASTADDSEARSEVLQRREFLGKLPAGDYPVEIPMQAKLAPGARVPEIEFDGQIYSCFDARPASELPAAKRFTMTPREFVHFCLDVKPEQFFACTTDVEAMAQSAGANENDECGSARAIAGAVGRGFAKTHGEWLKLVLAMLDRGQSTLIGVNTPPDLKRKVSAIWTGNDFAFGGGHALVVVGYVTSEELASVEEQHQGLLGQGIFDRIAGAEEPEYAARVAAAGLDLAALRDVRRSSKVGRIVEQEGGLLFVRNSWGAKVGNTVIGIGGYQSITFDYFLKAATLIESRRTPKVPGVAWAAAAGTSSCPAAIAPPTTSRYANEDHSDALVAAMTKELTPPSCAP